MDFACGRITRPHVDIDWFAWRHDLPAIVDELLRLGWTELGNHPIEQQRDLKRDGVELGFAPLAMADDGAVVVGGGPWSGAPWPTGILDNALIGELEGQRCPVISLSTQVEIKRMMPVWVPGMTRRAKDAADIALIESEGNVTPSRPSA